MSGRMWCTLMVLLCFPLFLAASDFDLSKDGVGPIHISASVQVFGPTASLTAPAKNNSGQAIQYAKFCVSPMGSKKCNFKLWTTAVWKPGEELTWKLSGSALRGIDTPTVTLVELRSMPPDLPRAKPNPRFDGIRRIYVDLIEGNVGALAREQLMAGLANSGRFDAVEDVKLADAVVKGRAELSEVGTESETSNSAIVGGVSILAARSAKGATKTATITSETVVVRLSLASGEILWGWDDTKPCKQTKAKCAIDDLAGATVLGLPNSATPPKK